MPKVEGLSRHGTNEKFKNGPSLARWTDKHEASNLFIMNKDSVENS